MKGYRGVSGLRILEVMCLSGRSVNVFIIIYGTNDTIIIDISLLIFVIVSILIFKIILIITALLTQNFWNNYFTYLKILFTINNLFYISVWWNLNKYMKFSININSKLRRQFSIIHVSNQSLHVIETDRAIDNNTQPHWKAVNTFY